MFLAYTTSVSNSFQLSLLLLGKLIFVFWHCLNICIHIFCSIIYHQNYKFFQHFLFLIIKCYYCLSAICISLLWSFLYAPKTFSFFTLSVSLSHILCFHLGLLLLSFISKRWHGVWNALMSKNCRCHKLWLTLCCSVEICCSCT